ncbi:tyrosine-type recombinase/integrase [[Eubacterium] cellulosolvens]
MDEPPAVSGEVVAYGFWMRKEGYAETTIERYVRLLRRVAEYASLQDPEAVKVALTRTGWADGTKEMACGAYALYARQHGFTFAPPRYRRIERLPFIPLDSEVDQLIAAMRLRTSTFLSLLKDTGARPLEAWKLKWSDIDLANSSVTITPLKHSKPRTLKLSSRTMNQLSQLQRSSVMVFGDGTWRTYQHFLRNFELARTSAADKIGNPRLKAISFRTLRHWKATTEYHRTKDILHVMQLLGHKNIKNTLVYTHLVDFGGDDYVCKVARNVDDAKGLIEDGFDYVTDLDELKLFRKRK